MTQTAPTEAVFRLVYRSHSRIPSDDRPAALGDLLREARSNNAQAGITGALLITDHWFVQALEGAEPAVRALYERICQDPRHDQVSLIDTRTGESRVFSRWAMAQISSSGSADIPLDAGEGEIHPTTGEPLTRDQFAVLKAMRDVIGADAV